MHSKAMVFACAFGLILALVSGRSLAQQPYPYYLLLYAPRMPAAACAIPGSSGFLLGVLRR